MSFVLQAPTIVLEDVVLRPGHVTISGGVITSVREGACQPGMHAGTDEGGAGVPVVEARGIVAAGFVDLHLHGGDGAQVNGGSPAEVVAALDRIGRFHARHGTTSFLATTVSDTPERLAATVAAAATVVRRGGPGSGDTTARGFSGCISRDLGSPPAGWAPRTRPGCARPTPASCGPLWRPERAASAW